MSKKLVLVLSGGLGNQLFQLCAGIFIEKNMHRKIKYDISNLSVKEKSKPGNYTRRFGISDLLDKNALQMSVLPFRLKFVVNILKRKILASKLAYEGNPSDDVIKKINCKTIEIHGFFQNAQIVEDVWPELESKISKSTEFSSIINSKKVNRIAIHARFGDYSEDSATRKLHGLTNMNYYQEAVDIFRSNVRNALHIVIITDDIKKAEIEFANLDLGNSVEFLSSKNPISDLIEIAQSSHVVMSNSTFSWWGAWFAYKLHNSQVIYPRPWFANIDDPELPIFVKNWNAVKRTYRI